LPVAPSFAWVYLALPYFAVLGLALPVCVVAQQGTPQSRHEKAQMVALSCAAGLLVNYAFGMLLADLRIVIVAGAIIAIATLVWLAMRGQRTLSKLSGIGWGRWVLAGCLLFIFSGAILFEPLQAWDARSIWFFQAKQIYYTGGLNIARDWTNPAYEFSHVDYPKLLPLLAAEFAQAWGMWNEYIPKAGLLMLLAPIVMGLFGVVGNLNLSAVFLSAVFLLGGKELLWNGYGDGYLALYGGLSLLFLARWLDERSHLDLVSGIIFLGVAFNLKNEGTLLAVCALAALFVFNFSGDRVERSLKFPRLPACTWLAVLLALVGYCAWSLTKLHWELPNDLQLGVDSTRRAWERIEQGGPGIVGRALLVQGGAGVAAGLFLLTAMLAKILKTHLPAAVWFPAAVAALYLLGLFAVYMVTPNPLGWHLSTSVDRTVLVAIAGFFGSCFLVLEAMESPTVAAAASKLEPLGTRA
jgi:hypothetical protein